MADNWMLGEAAALDDYIPNAPTNILGNAAQGVKDWYTSQPSWLDRAKAENQKTLEAYGRGGMGEIARQLATDTTEAQDLVSAFGVGNVKGVGGKVLAPGALAAVDEYRPPFYSAVEQAVQGAKQNAAPGQQWAGFLRNQPGVKPEEVEALKLGRLFEQPGSVPKEAVLGEIAANRVNVGEVYKGGDRPTTFSVSSAGNLSGAPALRMDFATAAEANAELASRQASHPGGYHSMAELPTPESRTKFEQYTLPGGENYREMLLTLPEQKGSGFDPAKVELRRKQQSTTQGSTIVSYDGKNIGTFDDPPTLNTQTGQYHQRPDQYWIDIMRRRYGGDPQMGIKPLDQGVNFRSSHYDEPNILAHVRYNDRVIDGKKTLFVEEVQSDWHQAGKRRGYRGTGDATKDLSDADVRAFHDISEGTWMDATAAERSQLRREAGSSESGPGVPDAPFKTTWPELAMKRIIREAAEKGYDKVAWTPGSVQADRYDLSRHIEKVRAVKNDDGTFQLVATPKNGTAIMLGGGRLPADEMADHIGKDLAEKIVNDIEAKSGNNWGVKNKQSGNWSQRFASKEEAEAFQQSLPETTRKQTDVLAMAPKYSTEYSGLDLKIGGEGMKGFYDEILPATVNRLVKKHGGRVTQGEIVTRDVGAYDIRETGGGRWRIVERGSGNHVGNQTFANGAEAEKWLAANGKTNQTAHTIDITPQLRAQAMKGFPLFTAGGVAATGIMGEMARQDEYR